MTGRPSTGPCISTGRSTEMAHTDHGQLMDEVYRFQRLIYDVTRKYYLLGRDRVIGEMAARPGQTVLEVACGTGRNLARIGQHYPETRLYGLDISNEMLGTARRKLGPRAELAWADACDFDPPALFEVATFDHIMLSYSLSMIPDWEGALREAQRHLAPGGTLHVVDFGDQADLPLWFKRGLRRWLDRFHVAPRDDLGPALEALVGPGDRLTYGPLFRHYAVAARLTKAA